MKYNASSKSRQNGAAGADRRYFEPESPPDGTRAPFSCCVGCGYDLTGHSDRFDCPECGFAYDAGTRIWQLAQPRFAGLTVAIGVSIGLPFLVPLRLIANPPRDAPFSPATLHLLQSLVGILGGLGLVVLAMSRLRSRWKPAPKGYLAVTPAGLVHCPAGRLREWRLTPWSEIESRVQGKQFSNLVYREFMGLHGMNWTSAQSLAIERATAARMKALREFSP